MRYTLGARYLSKNTSCALSIHQKECRNVWGVRYTLGPRYLSKNTVIYNSLFRLYLLTATLQCTRKDIPRNIKVDIKHGDILLTSSFSGQSQGHITSRFGLHKSIGNSPSSLATINSSKWVSALSGI